MKILSRLTLLFVCFALSGRLLAADAPSSDAQAKLVAKGAVVLPLAQDNDALVVSLAQRGKETTDADLALVKALPKVAQLNLAGAAITDNGLSAISGMTTL